MWYCGSWVVWDDGLFVGVGDGATAVGWWIMFDEGASTSLFLR